MKKNIISIILCCFTLIASAQEYRSKLTAKSVAAILKSVTPEGENLKTALFSDYSVVEPGEVVKVAVFFEIEMGKCIYGNEKSKTNLPTDIKISLPNGVTVEKIVWQKSYLLPDGEKKGYVGNAIAIVHLRIDKSFKEKEFEVKAEITYQICDDLHCIAGENQGDIKIRVGKRVKTKLFKLFE